MSHAHTRQSTSADISAQETGGWRIFAGLRNLIKARRNRAALERLLLTCNRRELADIGIDRYVIESALAAPWCRDPSEQLVRHRREQEMTRLRVGRRG